MTSSKRSRGDSGRRSQTPRSRHVRWLALPLGLALAWGTLWLLAAPSSGPPLDDIDDASRARLERVLEEADRGAGR